SAVEHYLDTVGVTGSIPVSRTKGKTLKCGCSAVGSASPCQGEGREFESRHPLWFFYGYPSKCLRRFATVEWPSGEATVCKTVHTGSIPVSTSICAVLGYGTMCQSLSGRALPRHGRGHWFNPSIAHTDT